MGGGESKPKVEERKEKEKEKEIEEEEEKEVTLGEGAWGKTYRKGIHVIKRFKYDSNDNDFVKEMAFYGWINTLSPDEQKYFSRLIKYSIYWDPIFEHAPKNIDLFNEEYKQKIVERNKSKWTVDLYIEYKGRKIDPSIFYTLSSSEKYKLLLQLLKIIRILKKNHVFHEDIHPGNIVIDDTTGNIALIDYGVTFLEGQRSTEIEARNEMLCQVTSEMANLDAFFSAFEKEIKKNPDKKRFDENTDFFPFLIKHAERVKEMVEYLDEFASKNNYTRTIHNDEKNIDEIHPTIFDVGDNLLRVMHPDLYLELYDLPTPLPPPYFGLDDLKIVYDNWNDIDKIISLFESKARE
jgi:hypothetical protein